MRITKGHLRQLIKEELTQTLEEEGILSKIKGIFTGGEGGGVDKEPDTLEKLASDRAAMEAAVKGGTMTAGEGFKIQKDLSAREHALKGTKPGSAGHASLY